MLNMSKISLGLLIGSSLAFNSNSSIDAIIKTYHQKNKKTTVRTGINLGQHIAEFQKALEQLG